MLMGTFPPAPDPLPPSHHSILASCLLGARLPLPAVVRRALHPSAVVLQRYLSPLSLCLLPPPALFLSV